MQQSASRGVLEGKGYLETCAWCEQGIIPQNLELHLPVTALVWHQLVWLQVQSWGGCFPGVIQSNHSVSCSPQLVISCEFLIMPDHFQKMGLQAQLVLSDPIFHSPTIEFVLCCLQ